MSLVFCKYIFVQLVLESLPISSSSHLSFMGLSAPLCVEFCVHGFTALVILSYFFKDWFFYLCHIRDKFPEIFRYLLLIVLSDFLTVPFFILIRFFDISIPVYVGLWITAFLLLSTWFNPPLNRKSVGFREAFFIGIVQGFSLLPGVSRFASTFVAGRWLGLSLDYSFRYSCALQIPLFGAAALFGCGISLHNGLVSFSWILSGIIVAGCFFAYIFLWFAEWLAKRDAWWLFGLYIFIQAFIWSFCR